MDIKLNNLKNKPGSVHQKKRVGRGMGSGLGKTAGRGENGQKSRSGVRLKGFEGGQTPFKKRIPKRGFNSLDKEYYTLLNFSDINRFIEENLLKANSVVDKVFLLTHKFIKNSDDKVKLLAKGEEISIPLIFELDAYSEAAKERVERTGGSIKQIKRFHN